MSLCWQCPCKRAWELYKDYPSGAYASSFTPHSLRTRALPVPRPSSQVGSISRTTPLIFLANFSQCICLHGSTSTRLSLAFVQQCSAPAIPIPHSTRSPRLFPLSGLLSGLPIISSSTHQAHTHRHDADLALCNFQVY